MWTNFILFISTTSIAAHNRTKIVQSKKKKYATKWANFTWKIDDNEKAQQIGDDQQACDQTQNSYWPEPVWAMRVCVCAIPRRMHILLRGKVLPKMFKKNNYT